MLDDALAQRRNQLKLPVSKDKIKVEIASRSKEAEKRPFEKVIKTKQHDSLDVPSEKKRKIDFGKSCSTSSSPEPQSKPLFSIAEDSKESLDLKPDIKIEDDSEATDIEEPAETDAGEFALEMGLACVVCQQMHVLPGNGLIECQDCHNLYHQECHRPPATEQDISDPRSIWYCAKCTKNQKKITTKSAKQTPTKPTMSASSAFQAAINLGKESAMQLIVKAAKDKQESNTTIQQPFKRTEIKSTTSSTSSLTSQAKPVGLGLASLAANIGRTVTASSSSSASSATASSTSSAAADKRLQMMKKKAAAKVNEKMKRTGSK
jgi:hypothetical protein